MFRGCGARRGFRGDSRDFAHAHTKVAADESSHYTREYYEKDGFQLNVCKRRHSRINYKA